MKWKSLKTEKNYGLVYDPKWKKLCKRHVNKKKKEKKITFFHSWNWKPAVNKGKNPKWQQIPKPNSTLWVQKHENWSQKALTQRSQFLPHDEWSVQSSNYNIHSTASKPDGWSRATPSRFQKDRRSSKSRGYRRFSR